MSNIHSVAFRSVFLSEVVPAIGRTILGIVENTRKIIDVELFHPQRQITLIVLRPSVPWLLKET